ncbi:MAG TPA: Calx-beta domain-containing protein [Sedimentisphaerales bacterium]|nr:Calx-beta domain-containing protein [Sedimentisphaerales bacterium]
MSKKLTGLTCLIVALTLSGAARSGVRLAFDCGGCGPLQEGWICIPSCGTYRDVGNTGIDVTVGLLIEQGECSCRSYFDESSDGPATGPLAYVEQDFLFSNDRQDSPDADIVITFNGLIGGARYRLVSYHNRLDEGQTTIRGVEVTGASDVIKPETIDQEHNRIINPAVISFTAGGGDVSIRYIAPAKRGKRGQVFLNGFVLEGGRPDVSFESATSSAVEKEGTVALKVVLSEAQEQPVTVKYAVTGGDATGEGLDYVLKAGTVTFAPGETAKSVDINIVGDGMDENDETIEVTLTNVEGADAEMGAITKHTHTIVDPRPSLGLVPNRAVKLESESVVEVVVSLERASKSTVMADIKAVGSTAKSGTDYKLAESGTLTFEPGQTTKTIEIELINDGSDEGAEQIVLELSNLVNAKAGEVRYTCTIVDGWSEYAFEMFKLDLGCAGKPETLKAGWTPWEIPNGCDGQPHEGRSIKNIAGTGVDARLSIAGDKAWGNLRCEQGQPICNSYYSYFNNYSVEAGIELKLSGLAAGEYWVYTYHNVPSQKVRAIPRIAATGAGVRQIGVAEGAHIVNEKLDDNVIPSLVKFYTDGSGPVTITYHAPPGSNAAVNAFALHNTVTPAYATNPVPAHKAKDVSPDLTLRWVAGSSAGSHHVYLGTDEQAVENATTSSAEYKSSVTSNSFKSPLLKFAQTYYWRIDEADESQAGKPYKSKVWRFTVDRGQARSPAPADGGNALEQAVLRWSAGAYGKKHEVYFGTSEAAVANADKSVPQYKGSFTETSYKPEALKVGTTYYWRVDQVGDEASVKGDIWSFRVTNPVHLKVDFALPKSDGSGVVEGSAKPGWQHWAGPQWADMYMHDGLWENGGSTKPGDAGIGGSGVHAFITTGSEGQLGLHVKGMCRDNLAGGGPPTGTPKGEPIANSWLYAVDWAGEFTGDILLVLTDLPAGRYELISYHNHWEPCSQATRHCMDCVCDNPRMPPMASITANALPVEPPFGYAAHWGLPKGTGKGVKAVENAYDVAPTNVLDDDKVATSRIVFETDGSEVLVIYRANTRPYPDCGRNRRDGNRGILNAFELNFLP